MPDIVLHLQIRENYRQKEKALSDFHDYVARTSDYSVLKVRTVLQQPGLPFPFLFL